MADGDIDYSRYTARELREALTGIRRDLYPQNHANILAALSALNEHATATAPGLTLSSSDIPSHVAMPIWFRKTYRVALYVFLVALLIFNTLSLTSGVMLALLRIAFQTATFAALLARKPWTWILVCIWSAMLVLSGIFLWLAVLFRGAIAEPTFQFVTINVLMVIGLFFLVFARSCLGEE